MSKLLEQKVVELLEGYETLVDDAGIQQLKDITRPFRLSDAIREGSTVSDQAYNWVEGDNLCALSAATVSARAHGFV